MTILPKLVNQELEIGDTKWYLWVETATFVQSKRFCSLMRQDGTKIDRDQTVELKKSFKLYRQILLKVVTKAVLTFIHFA